MANIRLVLEVLSATNLPPKDGEGSSNPFVEVYFDRQKLRTKTKMKELNPVWNERLEFTVSDKELLEEDYIEVYVYTHRRTGGRTLLGKAKIEPQHIKRKGADAAEQAISFPLERGWYIFSITKGEIFLKVYWYDDERVKGVGKASGGGIDKLKAIGSGGGGGGVGFVGEPTPKGSRMSGFEPEDTPSSDAFAVKPTSPRGNDVIRHDLVADMTYLFVRVEQGRNLAAKDATLSDPFVEVRVGNVKAETVVIPKTLNPSWREVFAIEYDRLQASFLEITVYDYDTVRNDFLGYVSFEIAEIPERRPPDSPLAPQWFRLESRDGKRAQGEIMLAVWIGTQADEAFPQARQSDSGWVSSTRAKVYLSPRLWYLRVNVLEAQDLVASRENRHVPELNVKVELGFQAFRTKTMTSRINSPEWKEEFLFVAAEPFAEEDLVVSVQDRVAANKDEVIASVKISLTSIEKRTNFRPVESKWYSLERHMRDLKDVAHEVAEKVTEKVKSGSSRFMSRIHLTLCLEGGYHVLDESTQYTSDTRPSDKRLWKQPVALLEVGLLGATGLLPMKTRDHRSCTDSYCVAKYGPKWVRTRTILDSLSPRWNEQYTWEVYDPCTVLTVGVFDNHHLTNSPAEKVQGLKDEIIGKVRIRLSTLETDRQYAHSYPLIVLDKGGVKKKGELEMVVRLSCVKRLNMMQAYIDPLLPKLHYIKPFNVRHIDNLREAALKIVVTRLGRSEPPLRLEIVRYMLDVDATRWSLRRSKANYYRMSKVFAAFSGIAGWFKEICDWNNPITTVLVHILYFILVWYPELILPTFFLYMFLIGAWQYRFRPRHPPHMDVDLSLANQSTSEELDEEFDPIPSTKNHDIVRNRYDRLRSLTGRIQSVVGDLATQLERFHALLDWRDPRATTIFILFCLLAAVILYVTPFRVIAVLLGIWVLRHPRFRYRGMPPVAMNFFRRLPALSDRML